MGKGRIKLIALLITGLCLALLLAACGSDKQTETSPFPDGTFQSIIGQLQPGPTLSPVPEETSSNSTPEIEPMTPPAPEPEPEPNFTPIVVSTPLPPLPTSTVTTGSSTTASSHPPTAPVTTAKPNPSPNPTNTAAPQPPLPTPGGPLSEVFRGKPGKKQVAITFDAGAASESFPLIASALKKYGVKITFFLTGQWARQNPTFVQQISSQGMEIANHTWTHPDLTKISNELIRDEIQRTDDLLTQLSGHTSKPLFRFPFGARDSRVTKVINEMGYRSIYWTVDSLDSVGAPKSTDFIISRITSLTDAQLDGAIILMHIGARTSAEALPTILEKLQERGFKIVTISQLLK